MTLPLVTIGMPVYNCESTIAESIASILNQTFQDLELIIFDDGSRDNTVRVARQFTDSRIRVIEGGRNRGLPACLNEVIARSETELFARMDGDDIAYPHRLEKQIGKLAANPQTDLLGGSILIFDQNGAARGLRRTEETHHAICGHPWSISKLAHVTWIGRTAWFRRHRYSEWSTHAQDRDLLTRTRRGATFAGIPDVLVGVREAAPSWRKLLPARRQMLRTALQEGVRQLDPSLLFVTSSAELFKLGLDFVATSTGLDRRLLKYRVPFVPPQFVAEWNEVLEQTRARVVREVGVSEALGT
jgi:glycosyltransferase involved in cell wall biosynthesis